MFEILNMFLFYIQELSREMIVVSDCELNKTLDCPLLPEKPITVGNSLPLRSHHSDIQEEN